VWAISFSKGKQHMANPVSRAFTGKGTVLSIGTAGATPVYTSVSELKTYNFSGAKNDTEDITNSDSAGRAREFLVTLLDSGEISIAGNYVASDAGQVAFKAGFNSGLILPFKLQLPVAPGQTTSGDVMTFLGLITENDISLQFDKVISFAAKIKLSGIITYVSGT
jgi:predicted secreted protein